MNFTFIFQTSDNKILVPIKNHSTDLSTNLSTNLQYKLIRVMNNSNMNNSSINNSSINNSSINNSSINNSSHYTMINRIQNGGKCLACNK